MNDDKDESFVLSNFELKLTCEGKLHFDRAVRIAFGNHGKAVAYLKPRPNQMVLYWHESGSQDTLMGITKGVTKAEKLPFELDADKAVDFLWSWLQTVTKKEMGAGPDIDGSVSMQAYCVEANDWAPNYQVVSVTKVWSEYHK